MKKCRVDYAWNGAERREGRERTHHGIVFGAWVLKDSRRAAVTRRG